jgi:phosphoenolpyruvate carboxylase
LPPEILGLYSLSQEELRIIKEVYPNPNFEDDLRDALAFYNPRVLSLLSPKMREQIESTLKIVEFESNKEHREVTDKVIDFFREGRTNHLQELIVKGALIRRFLG